MVTEHNADFGRLDGWVARRLMRRGPNGVTQLLEGTDPVLWAVVAHKWNREPGIRKLRFLAMRMGLLKQISPEDYQKVMDIVFTSILTDNNGDIESARRFLKLAENPGIDKNYEWFVDGLIKNSPQTRGVILKLEERMDVLEKLGLSLYSDYEVNDSKKLDLLSAKIKILYVFFTCNATLFYRWFRVYIKLQNDKARLGVARALWDDVNPDLVGVYKQNLQSQQKMYDEVQQAYAKNIKTTRRSYNQIEQITDEKYQGIAKYKELIRTGQLQPFKKK